jgi:hypothetical protein
VAGQFGNGRVVDPVAASRRDRELFDDATGPRAEQNDTVGESHCLADVVRNKHDGQPPLADDALELFVQAITG